MSNDQLDILDLTTDFLMKSISQEDEKKLMAWIESSPDNRRRFQTYCELWAASHHEHYDSQAAFRRFLKNKGALARKRDELRAKRRNHIYTVLLRAAVIVMPLLLATTILLYAYQERLLEKTITYTTVEGQQSSFILPDGTTVSMEENSCLSFSQRDFIHGTRKVTFEGEAYFDVTSDKLHPLDILTKQERVHVAGTGFKLLSRSGSEYNVLSLDHGSVEYTHLPTGERTALVGGDVLTLNKQAGKCHLRRRGPFEINLEADRELQDAYIQRY